MSPLLFAPPPHCHCIHDSIKSKSPDYHLQHGTLPPHKHIYPLSLTEQQNTRIIFKKPSKKVIFIHPSCPASAGFRRISSEHWLQRTVSNQQNSTILFPWSPQPWKKLVLPTYLPNLISAVPITLCTLNRTESGRRPLAQPPATLSTMSCLLGSLVLPQCSNAWQIMCCETCWENSSYMLKDWNVNLTSPLSHSGLCGCHQARMKTW